jgi:pimeloyl-ACP methyl ester carboxylesterase
MVLLDPPALPRADLVRLTQDPTEQRHENVADAIEAIRASGVSWSEGDIRAKAMALTQIDETAVRAIYLENGDYDAGMAALVDPAALDIPVWVIRGNPAEGGLIPDENVSALAERVGTDHVMTIAGAGHSPQRSHPEATILAILRALA